MELKTDKCTQCSRLQCFYAFEVDCVNVRFDVFCVSVSATKRLHVTHGNKHLERIVIRLEITLIY